MSSAIALRAGAWRCGPRMRAYVRLRQAHGPTVELGHGDLIGRLWSATLSIPGARVSEAQAMVSLRGQELVLLPLRGRFTVDGQRQASLVLVPGQRVTLAEVRPDLVRSDGFGKEAMRGR